MNPLWFVIGVLIVATVGAVAYGAFLFFRDVR